MKITLDMSISKLLDAFDREFGVSLGIYKGAHKSDNIKLFEIADPRKNQKAFIVINKDTSVESAEAMFRNTFGIRVQIKDKNGNTVSQENTLGGIRKLDKGYVDDENKSNINLIDDENTENKDDEKNNYGISQICLALGNIYRREQKALLAESYLSKGEALLLDLSHISKKYLLDLSRILIIKGQNYFDRFKGDEALSCYKRAEECMLKLPLDNPEEKYQLSSCYQNSGALFRKLCKKEEALKMFTKSRDIRLKLADDDPISFLPTLAYSYQGVGNALRSLDRKDEALDSYFHAYKIRKMIFKKNPNVHDAEMSDSSMKIASVYLDKKDPDSAYPYIKETISLRERLYKISNDTYFKWYAQAIFELGRYHEEKNNMEEAKQNYLESLHLQTSKDIDIPTNAEALHLIFKKLKEIYKEDFLKVLSPKEKEVHDDLYSYNDKHPDNKIVFDPLYQD